MRLKKISPDEAQHLCQARLRGDRLHLATRGAPSTWDPASRSARFTMSSEATDRMGDVVVTSGLDTREFERNPVGLLSHNSRSWPIGEWSGLTKVLGATPRLDGTLTLFPTEGAPEAVAHAAWALSSGAMKACSIGFLPDFSAVEMILAADGSSTGGLRFNQSKLLECSLVNIPANPDALAKHMRGDPDAHLAAVAARKAALLREVREAREENSRFWRAWDRAHEW